MDLTNDDLLEIWYIITEKSNNPEMRAISFMEFVKRYEARGELNNELHPPFPDGEFQHNWTTYYTRKFA